MQLRTWLHTAQANLICSIKLAIYYTISQWETHMNVQLGTVDTALSERKLHDSRAIRHSKSVAISKSRNILCELKKNKMHRWASVEANVFLVTKQNTTINQCEKCFVDQSFAALSIKCLKHKNTGGAKQSHNASLNKLKRIPSTHLFST